MRANNFMELRAFELVARRRSFSRAAEEIGMSRAALSALVKNFEQRIGIQLLNRTTRSVALTDAGEQLLERLSPALQELVGAVSDLDQFREKPRGRIRILTCPLGAELYLKPLVPAFAAAEPEVALDIHISTSAPDTRPRGFDAEISREGEIEKDLVAIRLGGPTRDILVGSSAYVQTFGRPLAAQDLSRHKWIEICSPPASGGSKHSQGSGLFGERPPILQVNSYQFAMEAALMGLGLVLVPYEISQAAIANGTLEHLVPSLSFPSPPLYLCYPRHSCSSLAFRAFTSFVKDSRRNP